MKKENLKNLERKTKSQMNVPKILAILFIKIKFQKNIYNLLY